MPKEPTSLRLRSDLKHALERRASAAGTSLAALYERLLEEGIRHDEHPLIVFRDGAGGRRAALVGTRLMVAQVIDTVLVAEGDPSAKVREAAAYLRIPENRVHACVRYYADYTDEVDGWRAREAEAADREQEAWRRQQAVIA